MFLKELWLLQEIDGVRKEKERLTIACFMTQGSNCHNLYCQDAVT